MIETKGYRDLIVWQKAIQLIPDIYRLIKEFPPSERFTLSDQMRRAVISIAANIAEGHGRGGAGEFKYFLGVSRGSLAELDTLMEAALQLGYLDDAAKDAFQDRFIVLRKLLFGLHQKMVAMSRHAKG